MIQRPQSIFITIMIIIMSTLFFLPVWKKTDKKNNIYTIYLYKVEKKKLKKNKKIFLPYYFVNGFFCVISIFIAIYELISYKNRLLQMKLSFLNTITISIILIFHVYFSTKNEYLIISNIQGEYQIGFIMLILSMINNIIANRFIKKDEYLIQSSRNII